MESHSADHQRREATKIDEVARSISPGETVAGSDRTFTQSEQLTSSEFLAEEMLFDDFDEEFTAPYHPPIEVLLAWRGVDRAADPDWRRKPRRTSFRSSDEHLLHETRHVDPLGELPPLLATTRRRREIAQKIVAERMRRSPSTISQLERTEVSRLPVGRLEEYIEALGGRLRVIAVFPDERLDLMSGRRTVDRAEPRAG